MWFLVYESYLFPIGPALPIEPLRRCAPPPHEWGGATPLRFREALYLTHHSVQDFQAGVPEARVRDVHPDTSHQLVGTRRSARRQELQVVVDEGWSALEVAVVDGQRQQVAERVRVDVARSVHEVAHVAPPDLVLLGEDQRVAEHRLKL